MEVFQWQAIKLNDSNYDGEFFYALRSTGTVCRPSCPSRTPNKKNI
ncbi:Ada metal-binding domain-containing protein [Paenibacillus amylolyticus]